MSRKFDTAPQFESADIPSRAGIGLKAEHYRAVIETRPDIGWFEVHTENYMGAGGAPHRYLSAIRAHYPLSLHGVGLSLGGADALDPDHLARTKAVVERYEPALVSEHLAWSAVGGLHFNDLLPVPRTLEALNVVANHVDQMQEVLGRQILVENPSTYVEYESNALSEPEFLVALARRTGCGLLVDVNNVYVSAMNHGFDAAAYLAEIPGALVGEIHLAGHAVRHIDGAELRIDDHGSSVAPHVWTLYADFVERVGPKPTLIEWDTNVPPLDIWLAEAAKADAVLARTARPHSVAAAAHG